MVWGGLRYFDGACNILLDDFSIITDIMKVIKHLPSGKAPSSDAMPDKINKAGGI